MVDFVGNPLSIGDNIVCFCMIGNNKNVFKTMVVGFTKCMVKIPKRFPWEEKDYSLVSPHNCVIYKEIVPEA